MTEKEKENIEKREGRGIKKKGRAEKTEAKEIEEKKT